MTNYSAQALTLPAAGAGIGIHLADYAGTWLAVFLVMGLFRERLAVSNINVISTIHPAE